LVSYRPVFVSDTWVAVSSYVLRIVVDVQIFRGTRPPLFPFSTSLDGKFTPPLNTEWAFPGPLMPFLGCRQVVPVFWLPTPLPLQHDLLPFFGTSELYVGDPSPPKSPPSKLLCLCTRLRKGSTPPEVAFLFFFFGGTGKFFSVIFPFLLEIKVRLSVLFSFDDFDGGGLRSLSFPETSL